MATYIQHKTVRFDLGDGWWVDLSEHLTQGQWAGAEKYLTATELVTLPKVDNPSEMVVRLVAHPDMENHSLALVSGAISDWNLTDETGAKLPLEPAESRRASIQNLRQEDFARILAEVNRLNAPRSDIEQASFRTESPSSPQVEDAAAGTAAVSHRDRALAAVGSPHVSGIGE